MSTKKTKIIDTMKNRIRLIILALAMFIPLLIIAQPAPNSSGTGGGIHGLPAGGVNNGAPIDGGISLVIMMAIGLGIKRKLTHPDKE